MSNLDEPAGCSSKSHVELMSSYVEAFYQVCRLDQQWAGNTLPSALNEEESCTLAENAQKSLQQQWNRSVFLEDPVNSIGHLEKLVAAVMEGGDTLSFPLSESDGQIRTALSAFRQIQSQYLPKAPQLTHLKPVSWITGKLNHLIDLRVLVVDRIPADHYAAYSKSVSDWTFLVLADETGSVVGAFHPDMPKAVARKLALLGSTSGASSKGSPKKLTELVRVGDVCGFMALKTIPLFGTTMVAFSTKSNVSILGTYMYDYAVQFGPRQG